MTTLYEGAFAKLNLTLDVLGKRDDGYHDVFQRRRDPDVSAYQGYGHAQQSLYGVADGRCVGIQHHPDEKRI